MGKFSIVVRDEPVILFAADTGSIFAFSAEPELGLLRVDAGELVVRSAFDVCEGIPGGSKSLRRSLLLVEPFVSIAEVRGAIFERLYELLRNKEAQSSAQWASL